MMQQTKRPATSDDALLDEHLEEGDEDGVLPEFPTQPFRFIPPKGCAPVPPRASRQRVSQAVPVQQVCQRTRNTEDQDESVPPARRGLARRALSWSMRACAPHLFPLGVGMLVMFFGIVLVNSALTDLQQLQLQWHYGDTRVTQADYPVGHGGTSHFVALYLDGQAIVMEFPHNDDATQMHLYSHRYYWHDLVHRLVQIKRTRIAEHDALLVTTDGIELPFVLYNNSDGTYHVNP